MNCIFCNNELPTYKSIDNFIYARCQYCPIGVSFTYRGDKIEELVLSSTKLFEVPYYQMNIYYSIPKSTLFYVDLTGVSIVFSINCIIDIAPSNFFTKLNKYILLS